MYICTERFREFPCVSKYKHDIVNAGKTAHFLLNFTLNKIKSAQIMNNRVYFVRNTCYFDVQ